VTTPTSTPTFTDAAVRVDVPLGHRVVVIGDLCLACTPTPVSRAAVTELAGRLIAWEGPGICIVAGNLLSSGEASGDDAFAAHEQFLPTVTSFLSQPERRFIVLPGWRDPSIASAPPGLLLAARGVEFAPMVALSCITSTGVERVLVAAGDHPVTEERDGEATVARPWLSGIDRLASSSERSDFVTARVLYRQLHRFVWVPPLVAVAALIGLAISPVFSAISHLVRRNGSVLRVVDRVHAASWPNRVAIALGVVIAIEVLVGLLASLIARRLAASDFATLDPGTDEVRLCGLDRRSAARQLLREGWRGLIISGNLAAELHHRDAGFLASPGTCGEVIELRRARLGLPAVPIATYQFAAVELETGWGLSVRLKRASVDLPGTTSLERLVSRTPVVKGYKAVGDLEVMTVASWPSGRIWPQAPSVAVSRRRTRRIRRLVATAIVVSGLVDLLVAVAPPLRGRLLSISQVLPVGVSQAAGALVAITGIALLMVARGVLRGQRRPWLVAVLLLSGSTVLHVVHAASLGGELFTVTALVLAVTEWRSFTGATDRGSLRSGLTVLIVGVLCALTMAFIATELSARRAELPHPGTLIAALAERLVGITTIALPDAVADWVTPVIVTLGFSIIIATLYLLTRPVVDRRRHDDGGPQREEEMQRARDLVARHGRGTLDYFALRDDKQFFFSRDSVVAYAVFGGICIASPDPIGPIAERNEVLQDFFAFADTRGWGVGVVGAAEEWLPRYLAAGMRSIYIGDEAVVDIQNFSLAGNKMKGLRQAASRVSRDGYTAHFIRPAACSPEEIAELVPLLTANRKGAEEKGFSMMLGRMFHPDDRDLLLTVVRDGSGRAVAMCQFVPSSAINGYSLDLMRRDLGNHPNGLLDFALCATIEELKTKGATGLSLNFAVLRSALAADGQITLAQRVERWALLRLSGYLQIESLWKFNDKYQPTWQPRYIVYDSPELFLPSVISFLRAESVSDVPVLGRLFSSKKRSSAVVIGQGGAEIEGDSVAESAQSI
jgi:lysylphosphatidylglycerol synthetase-like protein (DUF2156 family)